MLKRSLPTRSQFNNSSPGTFTNSADCHSTSCPARRLTGCLGPAVACDHVCQLPPSEQDGRPCPRWAGAPSSGPSDRCVESLRCRPHEESSAQTCCWLLGQTYQTFAELDCSENALSGCQPKQQHSADLTVVAC